VHQGLVVRGQAPPRRRLLISLLLALGCKAKHGEAIPDAAADPFDAAALPETVTVVLDAGSARSRTVMLLSGLPRPCHDRALGTVTFTQSDDAVLITSSKTRARGTCSRVDEHTLTCDWLGTDGRPTLRHATVTYGPGKKIGGSYDATHAFACPPQR
jgi:hypothetical protein